VEKNESTEVVALPVSAELEEAGPTASGRRSGAGASGGPARAAGLCNALGNDVLGRQLGVEDSNSAVGAPKVTGGFLPGKDRGG
jgi:hypothetical protein